MTNGSCVERMPNTPHNTEFASAATKKQKLTNRTIQNMKQKKNIEAEAVFDTYLSEQPVVFGSKEQKEALKWLAKIPENTDHEKVKRVMKKLGTIHVFRYARNVNFDYLPDLKDVLKGFTSDTIQSRLMLNCLYHSLENNTTPELYSSFCETAAFLQYADKFQQPPKKTDQLTKADQFITDAVIKDVEFALTNIDFRLKDQRILGSFVYVLAKSNSSQCEKMVLFQDENKAKIDRKLKLTIMKLALGANKTASNVEKAYHLVEETLKGL